jgi:hypothetical protein
LSFPQGKRACLPAGRSGILKTKKDSGQAGMTAPRDFRLFNCRSHNSKKSGVIFCRAGDPDNGQHRKKVHYLSRESDEAMKLRMYNRRKMPHEKNYYC